MPNNLLRLSSPSFIIDKGSLDGIKYSLDNLLRQNESFIFLRDELIVDFEIHNRFVQRFTFDNIA